MAETEKPLEIRVAQGTYKPNQGLIPIVSPGTPERGGPSPGKWPADEGNLAAFSLIDNVALKGGYAGVVASDPNARDIELYETILSGDLNGDDIEVEDPSNSGDEPTWQDNCQKVVSSNDNDANAILDGFTIEGGRNYIWTYGSGPTGGGGMVIYKSNPTIIDCTFRDNSVRKCGGGIYNKSSSPTLINCTFSGNRADRGAGIYNGVSASPESKYSSPALIDCTFNNNYAFSSGAGIYNNHGNPKLFNCTFNHNAAYISGGGMSWGENPELVNCLFVQNTAGHGGAIVCDANLTLVNCTFTNNSAIVGGGSISTFEHNKLEINNCIFTGNKVFGEPPYPGSGGVFGLAGDETTITNCTFYGNWAEQKSAIYKGSSSILRICNSIIWDGEDAISISNPSTFVVKHSDIQGGLEGEGNIDVDPFFTNPGYWADTNDPNIIVELNDSNAIWIEGDYHLQSQAGRWNPATQTWIQDYVTSPCIDSGDPNSPIGLEPFPYGGYINMGAYGGTSEASKSYFGDPLCETIVAGDINGDCKVDQTDLDILMMHWLAEHN